MNFDEWYRQSPTRLCGPTAEDLERGRKLREERQQEKQRTCEHRHTLPPNRWDLRGMCMECGKTRCTR